MNAHSYIAVPHFDRAWLEACIAEMGERMAKARALHHWSTPTWGAVSYLSNIEALAWDCLTELDGEEPDTVNPQAELAEVMDDCCVSILSAIERRQSAALLATIGKGHRAFEREGLA